MNHRIHNRANFILLAAMLAATTDLSGIMGASEEKQDQGESLECIPTWGDPDQFNMQPKSSPTGPTVFEGTLEECKKKYPKADYSNVEKG